MKTKIKNIIIPSDFIIILVVFTSCLLNSGCEDFIDVEDPIGQIPNQNVFENEETAVSAVTSMYGVLRDEVLLTGNQIGMSLLTGIYSDELDFYGFAGTVGDPFYRHQIIASNGTVASIWNSTYNLIYMSNSAIEGIEASQNLSIEIKEQLIGEALFIRALCHFYLVNLFGDVPYITTTDYLINKDVSRMSSDEVYNHIISDLLDAKAKLGTEYISGERIRANRFVVSAMLARVYLYRSEWAKADSESSELINNPGTFHLESDLNEEFLKGSSSAILQLKPKNEGDNTKEADTFLFAVGPPLLVALNPSFVAAFESGDDRKESWINELADENEIWYMPFKYKTTENTGTTVEYSIVFRLAEQYLIRAESRLHQGNLAGAKQDINIIRNRAGLADTNAGSTEEIMEAILKERRFELFTEQGNRWFDLKRLEKAGEILAPLKPNWKSTDILFPIPEAELLINPNLAPQNPGY